MKIYSIPSIIVLLWFIPLKAQESEKPKLVIGIVVDQMRYDYLLRFKDQFGEGGFKRLMNEGLNVQNTFYKYKPTKTAPGHASIFTGTTPSVHGIVGNNWYSREEGRYVYCVKLEQEGEEDEYSPRRLEVNTFSDEMKLMNSQSKVFGVSLKDRGAILPAGYLANAAYWFEGKQGGFISSSYYKNSAKEWVNQFNKRDVFKEYLEGGWKLTLEESSYKHLEDNRSIESPYVEGGEVTFPYEFRAAYELEGSNLIKSTPQGNQLLADFAKELIKEEQLGVDEHLDFISISFSSTDYIGHQFGVRSREVMDAYLKLDQTLSELLKYLDQTLEGNYILFLTADHGAAENREELKKLGMSTGHLNTRQLKQDLESYLDSTLGEEEWVKAFINLNVYFNQALFSESEDGYEREDVLELAYHFLKSKPGVANVYLPEIADAEDFLIPMAARGYHADESGELIIIEKANWNTFSAIGSGHESPYSYDTHVPLLFFGRGIQSGNLIESYSITDIVPSLSIQLGIGIADGVKEYEVIPLKGR